MSPETPDCVSACWNTGALHTAGSNSRQPSTLIPSGGLEQSPSASVPADILCAVPVPPRVKTLVTYAPSEIWPDTPKSPTHAWLSPGTPCEQKVAAVITGGAASRFAAVQATASTGTTYRTTPPTGFLLHAAGTA